jgi:hypothetical protein
MKTNSREKGCDCCARKLRAPPAIWIWALRKRCFRRIESRCARIAHQRRLTCRNILTSQSCNTCRNTKISITKWSSSYSVLQLYLVRGHLFDKILCTYTKYYLKICSYMYVGRSNQHSRTSFRVYVYAPHSCRRNTCTSIRIKLKGHYA